MSLETKGLYEFGHFRFDPAERLLRCEGKPVSLTPKMFEILAAFVRSGGRLLSKDELLKTVWPDSFVEEANLTVNISALRKTLAEGGGGEQYIETVPRRGYRFVMPVREVTDEAEAARAELNPAFKRTEPSTAPLSLPDLESPGKQARSRYWIWILALGLAAVCVAAAVIVIRSSRKHTAARATATAPRKLAILPFRNLGQNTDDDFLGLSLADAVITKLGYVSSVTVRPSYAIEQFRGDAVDPKKAAQALNADTLLIGGFIHEGDNLRITCQLVEVSSEDILWKGMFDLKYDKLLSVQDNVSQKIIQGLALSLSPTEAERMKPEKAVDPVAYEYYLRGVDLYSRSDYPTAIKMLEKSAQIAPDYPLTWAELGKAYTSYASFQFGGGEYYQKAQAAFERALSLQPAQIEAQVYMANLLTDTGRVEQAVPLLRAALKANQNHPEVHWELGYAYRFAGMLQESVEEAETARKLDPGVKLNSSTPNAYLYLGQYDKFLDSLPQNEDLPLIAFYRGFAEYHRGNLQRAQRHFDRAYELDRSLYQAQIGKALSLGIANRAAEGLAILRELESKIREKSVGDAEASYKIAQAYAVLGDAASGLRVLRHSIEHGFFCYPYLQRDPLIDRLRNEALFAEIAASASRRYQAFRLSFFPAA
jgi:DNA-binding winged helix-turn-helix (wHTH) protein/TolB-like protein/thioredoxin-like negative regulator of GroEL